MNIDNNLKIPNHVAIIMDGNGRWAKERGLSRGMGHKEGFKNLKTLAKHIFKSGVKVLSVYAFSVDNFKRSKEEVDFLMNLFVTRFKELKKLDNVKIVFSGIRKSPLPDNVIKVINTLEDETKNNTSYIFNICINYGGTYEILDACKKIAVDYKENNIDLDSMLPDDFYKYLYNDLPPIDFLIRTSGEERISNFMLYQLSYAEMYFPRIYFPDFDNKEFDNAILAYNKRDRRFGKINYNK